MGRRSILAALAALGGCTLSLDSKGMEYSGAGTEDPIVASCEHGECGFKVHLKGLPSDNICPIPCPGVPMDLPVTLSLSEDPAGAPVTWDVKVAPNDAGVEIEGPSSSNGEDFTVNLGLPLPSCDAPGAMTMWAAKNKALTAVLLQQKLCATVRLEVTAKVGEAKIEQSIDLDIHFYADDACTITSETCERL